MTGARQAERVADRHADAMANASAPLLLLSAEGRVEWTNSEARALLGEAGALPSAVELREGATPQVFSFSDGRAGECTLRRLGDGGWVATLADVSAQHRVAALAHTDALTGLVNRLAFSARLDEALARAKRTGAALAVLCIDLDRFKAVNDTLGHPVGDSLLRKVADRLRAACRESDVMARLGGDEFAILQTDNAQPEAAQALARRLVDLIGRTYVVDGHMLNIGASVGVAVAPVDGAESAVLLKNADLALYRAKADGRGVARFFAPEMDARMQARRSLELDLRKAMALKEFALVFQPQVRLPDHDVVGFEALLRWNQPERGLVSPADFIPVAEEIGLMEPIGDWVLRTACETAAGWARPVSVAVNVSAVQFRGGKLAGAVTSALARSGLSPERLELEITESCLLDDTQLVLDTLKAVRALGVRVSMDDFGTGYSSLSYLQKFPFDKIKIDQSFVRGMLGDADSRAIVRAVAALGASLGMRTIAEGVETPEELACVGEEGCTEVQGYLTGRPLSTEAAAALLTPSTQDAEGATA